ncbi:MAG: septal ring lytic transglycosylase RlpA family protein [Campylobacterota bacterium]|nr:septal ring lytic transglycosylase RlpA family protein [Campylobacterota bacterium]
MKLLCSILCVTILVFTGCSSKKYSGGSGYSSTKKTYPTQTHQKVDDSKIRNSKAMHRATMRPYKIAGKMYYPTISTVGQSFNGIASWYGPNFHAKLTSNGETYNMYAMTAASKTLPMNTMVEVYNKQNGKSVVVRINDRGPFVSGRIIDLSNTAAHAIDMVKKGTAKVRVTVLGFNAKIATTKAQKQEVATAGRYMIQVGAFRRYEGAKITQKKFESIITGQLHVIIKKGLHEGEAINRVNISGFRSIDEAIDFKEQHDLAGAMIIAQ